MDGHCSREAEQGRSACPRARSPRRSSKTTFPRVPRPAAPAALRRAPAGRTRAGERAHPRVVRASGAGAAPARSGCGGSACEASADTEVIPASSSHPRSRRRRAASRRRPPGQREDPGGPRGPRCPRCSGSRAGGLRGVPAAGLPGLRLSPHPPRRRALRPELAACSREGAQCADSLWGS